MNRVALKRIPLRASPFAGLPTLVHRVLFGLFLLQFAVVWANLWLPRPLFGSARWPDGLFIVLAAATTLASLARQLAGQNVMLAAMLIAFLGGAAQTLGALTALPFGPYLYTERIGQKLFHPLPWAVPLLWIVAILNARGVARLILRPWRPKPAYGFWLLGISALLVALLDVSLEPFATQIKQFWRWTPTKLPLTWYSTPAVNFLGWTLTALLILVLATPALINKHPGPHPPAYHPLLVWLLLHLLCFTGAVAHQLWPAAAVTLAQTLLVVLLVWQGRPGKSARNVASP